MDVCICKWLLSAQATILFEFHLRNRFIFIPEMKCMQQAVLDALFLAYTNFLIYRLMGSVMCAGMMACLCCHACNNARLNCLIKDKHVTLQLIYPFPLERMPSMQLGPVSLRQEKILPLMCFAFSCTIINC